MPRPQAMDDRPPLNWEASADPTNHTVSEALPVEVSACLRNARFLHLATCSPAAEPHISLMSHTYLPFTPWSPCPTIIMTTNPASRKTAHLLANPRVSLLVHDWVSPRTDRGGAEGEGEAGAEPRDAGDADRAAGQQERQRTASSSLASLLLGFNRAALGRISATVAGTARVLEAGSQEELWCRSRHVAGHGYKGSAVEDDGGDAAPAEAQEPMGAPLRRETTAAGDDGFLLGEDVRVVIVEITGGRIADWKGGLKDFEIQRSNGAYGSVVRP